MSATREPWHHTIARLSPRYRELRSSRRWKRAEKIHDRMQDVVVKQLAREVRDMKKAGARG